MLHKQYYIEQAKLERLLARKNRKSDFYNGIFDRYEDPVLTRNHVPLHWKYDLDVETNPYFMERLGVNAVMNSGAIELSATAKRERTANPSLPWRRATAALTAFISGTIR